METKFWTMQERTPITGFGKALLFFALVLILVFFLTGCAGPIQISENKCMGIGGSWEYTDAEGFRKFRCDQPAATSNTADRKLVGSIH